MNRNTLINIAVFAVGAAAGSVVTWKLVKTKYERIAQEEIDSVKEVFAKEAIENATDENDDENDDDIDIDDIVDAYDDEEEVKKAELRSYMDVVNEHYNIERSTIFELDRIGGDETVSKDGPYIITPNELGEEYDIVSLVCYADGVITEYNSGEIVDDVVGAIGDHDVWSHFGEYEDDSVFIRNDERKIDYEILRDEDDYAE